MAGTGQPWQLYVKDAAGTTTTISVRSPLHMTVLELKKLIYEQRPDLPPHKQKLVCRNHGRMPMEDDRKLNSYHGLYDKTVLNLETPWEIYLQAEDGRLHTVEIPSRTPHDFLVADLRQLSEGICRHRLEEYQFFLGGRVVKESHSGRMLTLGENDISERDTLILVKVGSTLNITNPKVDLCFLMDCTGSMGSWIQTVKDNIVQLRDKLEYEYQGCDLQFAFVRYTDYDQTPTLVKSFLQLALGYGADGNQTTCIDFTESAREFQKFVSGIVAAGGGDAPEDVMGGLKAVFSRLSWRHDSTKVLIHIADCPCHGKRYHDVNMGDTYPDGDPAGISHEDMMQEVAQNQVQYWFGYINKEYTDKMISMFNESLRRLSSQRLMIRQFDAKDPKEVGTAVHKSVKACVAGSQARKIA